MINNVDFSFYCTQYAVRNVKLYVRSKYAIRNGWVVEFTPNVVNLVFVTRNIQGCMYETMYTVCMYKGSYLAR